MDRRMIEPFEARMYADGMNREIAYLLQPEYGTLNKSIALTRGRSYLR